MESSQDIELINLAIQKLLEQKGTRDTSGEKPSEDDDEQLLSRLLSQIGSLKGDLKLKQSEGPNLVEDVTSARVDEATRDTKGENGSQVGSGSEETDAEKILKEVKAVKRQNRITHYLLSGLIVVTVIWQLSEVSMFLKVKDGLSHPFRSFGSMLAGLLPSPGLKQNQHEADSTNNKSHNQIIDPSLPSVQLPELPHVEFPHLGSNGSNCQGR